MTSNSLGKILGSKVVLGGPNNHFIRSEQDLIGDLGGISEHRNFETSQSTLQPRDSESVEVLMPI